MKTGAGLIYVFTGEGKGKTSAAVGTAVRAAGAGMKVAWVAFYKQTSWRVGEAISMQNLGIQVKLMGKGFHIPTKQARVGEHGVVVDTASEQEHREAAQAALAQARAMLGTVDVLVLDEVNNAVKDGLIGVEDLLGFMGERKQTHLILTGRDAHSEIVKMADLVTEMKKIKHPYDAGKLAVKGLDF